MKTILSIFLVLALLLGMLPAMPVMAGNDWIAFKGDVVVLGFEGTPRVQGRYHVDGKMVTVFLSVRGISNAAYVEVVLPFKATGEKIVKLRNVMNGGIPSGSAGRGLIIDNILYASPDPNGFVLWFPSLDKGFDALFTYPY
jgi:hypothetical protein